MAIITEHEFVVNEEGELALLLEPLDEDVVQTPTLIIARADAVAYLNLGAEKSHEIVGINPDILDDLCDAKKIIVIELDDDEVVRTFDATVGLLKTNAT